MSKKVNFVSKKVLTDKKYIDSYLVDQNSNLKHLTIFEFIRSK